jgi:hypothetical protein
MDATVDFELGYVVGGKAADCILGITSLVPTHLPSSQNIRMMNSVHQNAFSAHFSKFGFNFYLMLAVYLLHEIELSVWKAVFTHLMCILYASWENEIQMLNEQYVPSHHLLRLFSEYYYNYQCSGGTQYADFIGMHLP